MTEFAELRRRVAEGRKPHYLSLQESVAAVIQKDLEKLKLLKQALFGGTTGVLDGNSLVAAIDHAMPEMLSLFTPACQSRRQSFPHASKEDHEELLNLALNTAPVFYALAVTGPRPLKDTSMESYEKFYKRVFEYVCVQTGMDRALNDTAAGDEVRAAMESVFPLSTLARFVSLPENERLAQVEELARITLGICLYNRAIGKGGHALPAATYVYLPQARRLLRDIQRHIESCAKDLKPLAGLGFKRHIESCAKDLKTLAVLGSKAEGEAGNDIQGETVNVSQALVLFEQMNADLVSGLDASGELEGELQHNLLQQMNTDLVSGLDASEELEGELQHNLLQALVLFEQMNTDLVFGLDSSGELEGELQLNLLQVQEAIGGSVAVSKETIYPLFDRLGLLHAALNDELRLMVVRQRLFDELLSRTGGYPSSLAVSKKAASKKPWSASSDASDAAGATPAGEPSSPEAGVPEGFAFLASLGGFSQGTQGLALAGFCPVAMSQGLLVRFDPSPGFIKDLDTGSIYGFASVEGLEHFCSDPKATWGGLDQELSTRPLVAKMLGQAHKFPVLDTLVVELMSGPLKVDFGSQTPTHFIDKHIDHSYEWNEWCLRRRALQLANLRQKATHSTQTGLSHFKRDGETQVWQPKQAQVQTRANKGQAMPKKLQYVAGLRGAPNTKMNVVRLEMDLGQPHQH
eukprot:gene22971-30160_t